MTGVDATTLAFSMEVVRGRDYAPGGREGEAPFDPVERTAVFAAAFVTGMEVVATRVDFVFLDGGVTVVGMNALPWHGLGATFDGRYLRVPLGSSGV